MAEDAEMQKIKKRWCNRSRTKEGGKTEGRGGETKNTLH